MARKSKQVWDAGKAAKAAARAAHFAGGGTLAMWRGRPATFTDRKAASNKRACRARYQE